MNSVLRTRLTAHAKDMLARRELALEWIEDTLRNPSLVRTDETDPALNLAFKQIRQADDKWLRVVYRMDKLDHLIITAFFDRGMEKQK